MEYGAIKAEYSPYLMRKNFVQFSVAMISYWCLGYGFSFRHVESNFIGEKAFGGEKWLKSPELGNGECFSFYGLTGIFVLYIINLGIPERTSYVVYIFFSAISMVFVWPAVVAWVYGKGWLFDQMENQILDYGGDIVVYVFAGSFAFAAILMTGNRQGRYSENSDSFVISKPPIYIIGCFLTALGVFGIAAAQQPDEKARVNSMHNLWISASTSAIVSLKLVTWNNNDIYSHYISLYQGFIAGMVAIASSSGNTMPWEAGIVGILNGFLFTVAYKAVRVFHVDDSVDVTATFLVPGVVGGVLPGFLDDDVGVFWAGWESGQTLGTQTVGTFVVLLWALFWALVVLLPFKCFKILNSKDSFIIQEEVEIHHHDPATGRN